MRVLQVLDQAFRTVVEEQDETILWLIQSMLKPASEDTNNELMLLLTDNAVQYAYQKDPQPSLKIGDWQQSEPADIKRDIKNLLHRGVRIYIVYEDVKERGLDLLSITDGIEIINRDNLPKIYRYVDQVWHW